MAKISSFQDLECWQAARRLVYFVYQFTQLPPFKNDYELKDQLRSAAISIMNNIAEGFGRFHRKDSLRFYDYAQSSANELMSMSFVLEDLKYLSDDDLRTFRDLINEAKNKTMGFIRYCAKNPIRGNKFIDFAELE